MLRLTALCFISRLSHGCLWIVYKLFIPVWESRAASSTKRSDIGKPSSSDSRIKSVFPMRQHMLGYICAVLFILHQSRSLYNFSLNITRIFFRRKLWKNIIIQFDVYVAKAFYKISLFSKRFKFYMKRHFTKIRYFRKTLRKLILQKACHIYII